MVVYRGMHIGGAWRTNHLTCQPHGTDVIISKLRRAIVALEKVNEARKILPFLGPSAISHTLYRHFRCVLAAEPCRAPRHEYENLDNTSTQSDKYHHLPYR